MTLISVSEAKSAFSKFVNRAAYGRERIVVTSHGQPKAALIGLDDLERLEQMEEMQDALAAYEAVEAHQNGETIPWEQIKAELLEGSGVISG
jgi:prevent-host-death family protein